MFNKLVGYEIRTLVSDDEEVFIMDGLITQLFSK